MHAEHTMTDLKLLNTLIAESAGKIIKADIKSEPTKFIASTIITAIITAITTLYASTFLPVAFANVSSKVTANSLLYANTKNTTTKTDNPKQIQTSVLDNVKIDVEPNNVLQTSPDKFADAENTFNSKYPIASEPTEISAIKASPLILAFWPTRNNNIAATIVTGITIIILSVNPAIPATAIAPKATCDKPSPIYENLLSTSVAPNREAHNAISTPTISAYLTNGN